MARSGLDLVLLPANQRFPGFRRQFPGQFVEPLGGVDAKDELHALAIPVVQTLGLREVGVAPQANLSEASPTTQRDGPIEIEGRLFVAGPIAAAIDNEQRLARVGQREHQRMIAPLAFVVDVHALFALAAGLDHRAVGLQDRLVEERRRLLPPDLQADRVEDRLQTKDGGRVEAAAIVAGGGRIGHTPMPRASRYASSLRSSSRCSKHVPPANRL